MMEWDAILTILTPAESQDLTTLATVKDELGISVSTYDTKLTRYLQQASSDCAQFCRRVFGQEVVSEQFRLGDRYHRYYRDRRGDSLSLRLARFPVSLIGSVRENAQLLTASDYELDAGAGLLWRLSGTTRTCWAWGTITVDYTAGYALLGDLPPAIEQACIELVKLAWHKGTRDPSVRQISIPGVIERQYWVGSATDPGIPQSVQDLLTPFAQPAVT